MEFGRPKKSVKKLAFPQLRLIIIIDNIYGGTHQFEIGKVDLERIFIERRNYAQAKRFYVN
jgi:hypothetical protein